VADLSMRPVNSWLGYLVFGSHEIKVRLSDSEVAEIIDAVSPAAALATLLAGVLAPVGIVIPAIPALAAVVIYSLKSVNRRHGNRGVTIRFRAGIGMGLESLATIRVWGPDA
jgi:hypothetical protein